MFPLLLGQDNLKLSFIQQLRPTQSVQPRIKLKLFGHSGAGKSTLLESLKCGILRSFFRRRRPRGNSTTRHPNSPVSSKPAGTRRSSDAPPLEVQQEPHRNLDLNRNPLL